MNAFQHSLFLLATIPATALFAVGQEAESAKTRIGTYDSRAIAIAFAPSKFNPVAERMKEYEKAKADGNAELMEELDAWGQKLQRQLHRQAFAIVPVGNLLENVKDQLPNVAKSAKVVAIVRASDFTADQAEEVDVTDALVNLFDPSERTRETIRQIRKQNPIDLDEVEQHHQN